MYGSTHILAFACRFYVLSICTFGDSCDYMIIFVYSMVGWMICHLILFRVLIKRISGFTVSEVCAYEPMFPWCYCDNEISKALWCHATQTLQSLILVLTPRNIPRELVSVCTNNRSPPGMILPLALLLKYWIEHVTIGLLYVKFIVSTRILYKGVPGLATDCLCGVVCC